MKFGFIKVNNEIAQIFIDKDDDFILNVVNNIKNHFDSCNFHCHVIWDNFYSEKTTFDLEKFMKS